MIRVLLVDDQQLVRAGLRMLCDAEPDMQVVDEARDGQEAIRLAARTSPDVILMDLRMPGMDGVTATAQILAARPATRIVVVTTFDDDDHLYPAIAAGACGFLVKDTAPEDLLAGIRRAAAGDSPFSPAVLHRLVSAAITGRGGRTAAEQPADAGLSRRESQVVGLVSAGLSNAEIAERLHLGVTTVKTHVAAAMAKTGASNRVRLAVYGIRLGLASEPAGA
ncbi:DNA-binding response regulator [Longispora fulva]|uniref:DNA-binding NarL/FixJ family response regulator n=1 Tax=Longispora fulva TaxID=619741 RepID=A0A8J7G7I1_9ACTN|nr:response regulator transcription factor [Longispora fulva]MBG6134480.1 DNA-binding NarL/FixJ family response regulator [Longispora fulva]GIG62606.1 DNA-binding response regulator [Longispora fulva]